MLASAHYGADSPDASSHLTQRDEIPQTGHLTITHFERAMEAMSAKLIRTWQSTADQIKNEVRELSNRTASVENDCQDLKTAQTGISENLLTLQQRMEAMEGKLADYEDRARRNNLRLRGVPESVQPDDLQLYVRGLMHAYAPDIPSDMLLVDRVHRVPKPKHLPDSAPRDVVLRAHYYHIKELVLRAHRSRQEPHEDYPSVLIMADLSAATLRRRRDFQQVTTELRDRGIRYRWGFPTKLILTKNGETKLFSRPEDAMNELARWSPRSKQSAPPASSAHGRKSTRTDRMD
ncbi:Hypothetical predicted protein [Pelobates cultripes]|uniref:Transposase element L1Md-A101/L1Md-A102/L1Md-A2 n=1 Tax=Pelobates cultripes TaxID=61616 RepID=A0AAD1VV80_PELCU|nr:Hypothetical predicted protein [Pelobates cultripes]